MRGNRKNRVEALLGVGLLGISIPLGLLALSIYQEGQQAAASENTSVAMTSVPPSPTPVVIELWNAYEQACVVAQAKAQDAQLVSASTQWQAASEEALLAGPERWVFTFYSPANGCEIDAVVSAEKAWVVNQSQVWHTPTGLSEGRWSAGPRDILLVFLANGAREFLNRHPDAMVQLHLAEHKDGHPAWNAIVLDAQAQDSFALLIDADTMQALSIAP